MKKKILPPILDTARGFAIKTLREHFMGVSQHLHRTLADDKNLQNYF